MERPSKIELPPEQIEAKITALEREILAMEEKMKRTHEESGDNSLDDNGQEETLDIQQREIMASQIGDMRNEMVRLQNLLPRTQQAA